MRSQSFFLVLSQSIEVLLQERLVVCTSSCDVYLLQAQTSSRPQVASGQEVLHVLSDVWTR